MKNFDWKNFLTDHPIFKRLSEDDIKQLLKDEISEERVCLKDSVIIREGELGDSIFFIGSGSVRVVLQEKDGREVTPSILKKGDFFGEISTFEKIPRSATIIAQEKSTLLETEGNEFSKIIEEHPDIAFRIFSKLSERLRHMSECFLTAKLTDVDEKFNIFNAKLDAELKAVDASLSAAQVVFDQTKEKSEQVINDANKSWTHLKKIASALGILITVVISIFAWFGINKYQDISKKFGEKLATITEMENEVRVKSKSITEKEKVFVKNVDNINDKADDINEIMEIIPLVKKVTVEAAKFILIPEVLEALDKGDSTLASTYYEDLLQLHDLEITSSLLLEIEIRMIEQENIEMLEMYQDLLAMSVNYINIPREKITAYYLSLAVLILNDKHKEIKYERTISDFKRFLKIHKGVDFKNKDKTIADIDVIFEKKNQEKQDLWFKDIRPLIP